jgi:glutamate-1-semialdehyde 2,1-aminomutase
MTASLSLPHLPRNRALQERAALVIPGGIYGHLDAALTFKGAPQFVDHADGSRFWDVDGNEYLDLMCSWGPILHGHRHPKIEAAVARQVAKADTANGPGEVLVELAELFTATVAHADWAIFAKNGSDATTLCLTLARAKTHRRTILVAEGAYHGALPWCNPNVSGALPSDRQHLSYYRYNDLDGVRALAEQHRDDLAGIIASAFRHDAGYDQELPTPEFARGLREICDQNAALLILDEVRAGFRLSFGGSWEPLGVQPDLSAWSKAIGNGYPIAAVLGADEIRAAAQSVFATGSFWMSAGPMAAAVATINLLAEEDGVARMSARGQQLRDGITEQARSYGLDVNLTGPVTMPYLSFAGEDNWERTEMWTAGCISRGLYVHPRHNWFLSTALTEADIEQALQASDASFADVARHFGR